MPCIIWIAFSWILLWIELPKCVVGQEEEGRQYNVPRHDICHMEWDLHLRQGKNRKLYLMLMENGFGLMRSQRNAPKAGCLAFMYWRQATWLTDRATQTTRLRRPAPLLTTCSQNDPKQFTATLRLSNENPYYKDSIYGLCPCKDGFCSCSLIDVLSIVCVIATLH